MNFVEQANTHLKGKGTLVFLTYVGSKLYGTDNENSDTDLKGIYIPNLEDMLLGKEPSIIAKDTGSNDSKNTKTDVDFTLIPFQKFLNDLKKAESQALDLFFAFNSPSRLFFTEEYKEFFFDVKPFLKSKLTKSFVGYCLQQASKYGVKGKHYSKLMDLNDLLSNFSDEQLVSVLIDYDKTYEEGKNTEVKDSKDYYKVLNKFFESKSKIKELKKAVKILLSSYGERTKESSKANNVDFKSLSHAFRVMSEVQELLEFGNISFPLKDAKYIKEIKEGKHTVEVIQPLLEEKLSSLDSFIEKSNLPDVPNSNILNGYGIMFLNNSLNK
jgi:predicted nucleotidyltransferase